MRIIFVRHGDARLGHRSPRAAATCPGLDVDVAALAGSAGIHDEKRKALYVDLARVPVGEAARRAFEALMLKNYEYQSDFARKYFADGLLVGELKPLVRQFERRLARPLSVDERGRLTAGVRELGAERVGELVLDLTPEALAAWLTSPSGHERRFKPATSCRAASSGAPRSLSLSVSLPLGALSVLQRRSWP